MRDVETRLFRHSLTHPPLTSLSIATLPVRQRARKLRFIGHWVFAIEEGISKRRVGSIYTGCFSVLCWVERSCVRACVIGNPTFAKTGQTIARKVTIYGIIARTPFSLISRECFFLNYLHPAITTTNPLV